MSMRAEKPTRSGALKTARSRAYVEIAVVRGDRSGGLVELVGFGERLSRATSAGRQAAGHCAAAGARDANKSKGLDFGVSRELALFNELSEVVGQQTFCAALLGILRGEFGQHPQQIV